jgi:hypothetical protein
MPMWRRRQRAEGVHAAAMAGAIASPHGGHLEDRMMR